MSPGRWALTEADGAFLDLAQVVGTPGRLGATAPRTAGAACRPACAPASPFPTRAWPARECWRKDGCAIGRLAIVSGGMTRGTRSALPARSSLASSPPRALQGSGELSQGCVGAVSPRGCVDLAVHGPARPRLSRMRTCWHGLPTPSRPSAQRVYRNS